MCIRDRATRMLVGYPEITDPSLPGWGLDWRTNISHLSNNFMCRNLPVSQTVSYKNMNMIANNLFPVGAQSDPEGGSPYKFMLLLNKEHTEITRQHLTWNCGIHSAYTLSLIHI